MVGRIGGTIKVVPGREVILHEPRWDTVEVVGMWWLVKWWVLLVLLEGRLLAEMGGPLHSKWWIPLASPGGLMLVVPGGLILVIPGWLMLIVPWSIPLVVPIWFPLVIPHSFMVVIPGLAMRWALVWSIKTLVKLAVEKKRHTPIINWTLNLHGFKCNYWLFCISFNYRPRWQLAGNIMVMIINIMAAFTENIQLSLTVKMQDLSIHIFNWL